MTISLAQTIRPVLLDAPDTQIDATMKPLVSKWSEPPTPLEILEVLDHCINGGLASSLIVSTLQLAYDEACKSTGTTHEEVIKSAIWRKP